MTDHGPSDGGRTRRRYLLASGGLLGSGLLAGCLGGGDGDDRTQTPTDSPPGTTDSTATEPSDEGASSESSTEESQDQDGTDAYSVTMEPVGTVEFDRVPESIVPFTADYIDMLVALGQADAVESVWFRKRYKTTHYDDLDGVSIDLDSLTELWSDGISKEPFYEIDADLHLIDPNSLTTWLGNWDESDVDEIRENVAPFVGNLVFRRTDDWHDYRYYTLYEAFEKVAEVVQERERCEAIRGVHEDVVSDVQSRLPAPDDRPKAALVFAGEEPDEFYPYRVSGEGANKEHFHTIGLTDAFEGTDVQGLSTKDTGAVDYETMLEIDPESLLLRYHGAGKTREDFEDTVLGYMRDHEVGSQLSAVQNDMVFRGGPIYTGPLHNLFMIERYAQAYYPEEFGDEQLFDRDRLARIITEGSTDE